MNTLFQTRIDANQKKAAEQLFRSMGMTLGGAFKMFVAQSLNERGLPFQPTASEVPNQETLQAMKEVEEGKNLKRFNTAKEMMADLMADGDE